MEIEEFSDGYCLTHKTIDYKYQGKSKGVIDMIAQKVKNLLEKDLEELKSKLLKENFIS